MLVSIRLLGKLMLGLSLVSVALTSMPEEVQVGVEGSVLLNSIYANEQRNAQDLQQQQLLGRSSYKKLGNDLEFARLQYEGRMAPYTIVKGIVDTTIIGGATVASSTGVGAVPAAAGGFLLQSAFDSGMESMKQTYAEEQAKLYLNAFAYARKTTGDDFLKAEDIKIENLARLRAFAYSGQDIKLQEARAKVIPPDARNALQQAEIGMLKQAFEKQALIKDKTDAELQESVSLAKEKIAKVDEDVKQFRTETTDALKLVQGQFKAIHDNSKIMQEELQGIKQATVQNTSDIAYVQHALYGRMTPTEQLDAITKGGFFRDMPVDKKGELVKNLKVLSLADSITAKLETASAVTGLLTKVGVLNASEASNLNKNIKTATAVVNVAASIATGNYVGAIMAAGGLFGGGEDPAQAQHAEIMAAFADIKKELEEVKRLQKETLQKLNDLSNQLTLSTKIIRQDIASLRRLTVSFFAESFSQSDEVITFDRCAKFFQSAHREDIPGRAKQGAFASYADRVSHFQGTAVNEQGQADFHHCMEKLNLLVDLKGSIATSPIPAVYRYEAIVYKESEPERESLIDAYGDILEAHYRLLKANSQPERIACATNLVVLSAANFRLTSSLPNIEGTGSTTLRTCAAKVSPLLVALKDSYGLEIGERAIHNYVEPIRIIEVSRFLQFLASYEELIYSPGNLVSSVPPVLPTSIPVTGNVNRKYPYEKRLATRINAFIDILSIGLAQQRFADGILILPHIVVNASKSHKTKDLTANGKDDDERSRNAKRCVFENDSVHAQCLLKRYPLIARNVETWISSMLHAGAPNPYTQVFDFPPPRGTPGSDWLLLKIVDETAKGQQLEIANALRNLRFKPAYAQAGAFDGWDAYFESDPTNLFRLRPPSLAKGARAITTEIADSLAQQRQRLLEVLVALDPQTSSDLDPYRATFKLFGLLNPSLYQIQ